MKRPEFINGYFYHVYNRGVDKRKIYLDKQDYTWFINGLYDFNDLSNVINFRKRYRNSAGSPSGKIKVRGKLVDIICFCIMPNHFHFILRQLIDNGIPKFIQKLSTSYAMYFNQKYERTGRLYEGRFKAILIEEDEYLMHLSRYIHLNPVDLIQPDWREKLIKNLDAINTYLDRYRWSSYHDYIGKNRSSDTLNIEPMKCYFRGPEDYRKYIRDWTSEDIRKVEHLVFENKEFM